MMSNEKRSFIFAPTQLNSLGEMEKVKGKLDFAALSPKEKQVRPKYTTGVPHIYFLALKGGCGFGSSQISENKNDNSPIFFNHHNNASSNFPPVERDGPDGHAEVDGAAEVGQGHARGGLHVEVHAVLTPKDSV